VSSHDRAPAAEPEDLERLFVERVNTGDVEGLLALSSTRLHYGGITAEVARRQADGSWRWVIDQWNVLGE
jgi:hypothetical protein